MSPTPDRISVSTATLRAELAQLELRLVDRINLSLAEKANLAHVVEIDLRMGRVEDEMTRLQAIGNYRKWLWAQTIALVGLAIPIAVFVIQHIQEGA